MATKEYTYRPRGRSPNWWYGKTPRSLTDEEVEHLLITALGKSFRDHTLILFALNTGLRNTEVIGLNVEDVWFGDAVVRYLDVPARIAKGHKTRSIPLNGDIQQVLDAYILDERASGRITGGDSPLFRAKISNKRLGPRDFQQIVRRHGIAALNHPVHPHMLRHTFATKLAKRVNLKIVQEFLGHYSLQTTQIYLHPSSSDKVDAVEVLNFTSGQKE